MAKSAKSNLEILLVRAEINGLPEKKLLKSRNLGAVDLIWPRTGVAKKSAAREMVFKKGVADFTSEAWTNRVLYREEIEGRCGFAVTITEPVTVQLARRFVRLTAKYALRLGANYAEKAMVSFGDIATSPVEALAQMIGEKDTPKAIAQGVVDFGDMPKEGEAKTLVIPLKRPLTDKEIGSLTLEIRG